MLTITMISGQTRKLCLAFLIGNLFSTLIFYFDQIHSNSFELKKTNSNDILDWSIRSIVEEDKRRIEKLKKTFKSNVTLAELRRHFYSVVAMPLQSLCATGKIFGGQWLDQCGALDGHKFNGECLIYSYGIANDWSFETAMSQLGCTVRAFDPTIDGKAKPDIGQISFEKIGLNHKSEFVAGLGEVLTLVDAVKKMGDVGKRISYLKMDVEGNELKVLPEWISSGILDNIDQFGLEIHTAPSTIRVNQLPEKLSDLLQVFRQLDDKGFRIISSMNNECVAKAQDFEGKYFTYFEVVFYKSDARL